MSPPDGHRSGHEGRPLEAIRHGTGPSDQRMQLVYPMRFPVPWSSIPRAYLIDLLAEQMAGGQLSERGRVVHLVEHRIRDIEAMIARPLCDGCYPAPYGFIFKKQWLCAHGAKPANSPETAAAMAATALAPEQAQSGRWWTLPRRDFQFGPSAAFAFVPDALVKAALLCCGFKRWTIIVLEEIVHS